MAGTLNLNVTLAAVNGSYNRTWTEAPALTQAGQGEAGGIIVTGGAANIDVGGVTTLGYLMLKNIDLTNSIGIGITVAAAYQEFCTLAPSAVAILPLKAGQTYK